MSGGGGGGGWGGREGRALGDLLTLSFPVLFLSNNRPIVPMEYMGNTYFTLKNLVIKAERRILKVI